MRVERAADVAHRARHRGNRSWTLMRVDSAAQEKYSEGLLVAFILKAGSPRWKAMDASSAASASRRCRCPGATMRIYDLRAPTF